MLNLLFIKSHPFSYMRYVAVRSLSSAVIYKANYTTHLCLMVLKYTVV